jgi:hypothetical protein
MMQLAIYDAPGGNLIADYTHRATGVSFATNERGFAECKARVSLLLSDAFYWHDRPGLPHVVITDNGETLYEGRLEDPGIGKDGLQLAALGYSRALTDTPYTALWGTTSVRGFVPVRPEDVGNRIPTKFEIDTNNRIYIAPKKGEVFATGGGTDVGGIVYQAPNGSSRGIVGVQFDYAVTAPNNYAIRMNAYSGPGFAGASTPWSLTATGVAQTGSVHITMSSAGRIEFYMFNDTGAAINPKATDTGADFLRITNLRIVTSTTNRVNTTLTALFGIGSTTNISVGSTANMYVGQELILNSGGATSERVVVTAVVDSTHFNCTAFLNSHNTPEPVQGFVIYADEIVKDVVATVNALNSNQLSSNTTLIQSPGLDLLDEVYEDMLPSDILDYLAALGDNASPPRQWEWKVWEDQRLAFQPQGNGRTWYVDVTDLEVVRTLEDVYNSVYAVYQDASNRKLRTAANTDTASINKYGITRQRAMHASTTSNTQATTQRDAALQDQKDPKPRAGITFSAVYDAGGGRYPLTEVRAGDTFVLRNLPPTLSSTVDRIRSFRLSRTTYDADKNTLTVEPEAALPTLDFMLARGAAGVGRAGNASAFHDPVMWQLPGWMW